jgi:hypothetical protein
MLLAASLLVVGGCRKDAPTASEAAPTAAIPTIDVAAWPASAAKDSASPRASPSASMVAQAPLPLPLPPAPLSPPRLSSSFVQTLLCNGAPGCRLDQLVAHHKSVPEVVASIRMPDDPVGDDEDEDRLFTFETWLVTAPPGEHVQRRRLTRGRARQSEDGASPATSDVHGARLHYSLDGTHVPSTWVGTFAAELGLDPPELISESRSYWNRMVECASEVETWSWESFAGSNVWQGKSCGDAEVCEQHEYALVPAVSADAAFAESGWKDAALGRCALDVDGSKGHGFGTFGKTRGRGDAFFRAVIAGDVLFVEIHDDAFTGPSASWVNVDHLEVWIAEDRPSYMLSCDFVDGKTSVPRQWGIGVVDGQVFAGSGKPTDMLQVERVMVDAHTARMRVVLPVSGSITVVYSDSDDGRKQKSLLATSKLSFGNASTLGAVKKIDAARARCVVIDGKLEPRTAPVDPSVPLYAGDD